MNFGKKLHYLGVQQNIISMDNSVYYMFFAFISGKSYFDFLRGGGGEE